MKVRSVFFIALAGVLWGTSGIFVHYLSPLGFTPFMMSAVRGAISLLSLCIFALIKDKSLFKIDRRGLLLSVLIGAALWATGTTYYTAMGYKGVAVAVVLMYTAPVYVTVFSAIFMRERMGVCGTVATVLMLIGSVLVSGILTEGQFNPFGVAIGVLCGIVYAIYNIGTKIALTRGTRPVTVTLYAFLFMTLISIIPASPGRLFALAEATPYSIPLLIGLAIFTFVLPYVLYTLGMRGLAAGPASALGTVEPVAATAFSMICFGEMPSAIAAVGMVLIIGAVLALAISQWIAQRRELPRVRECEAKENGEGQTV